MVTFFSYRVGFFLFIWVQIPKAKILSILVIEHY